MKPLHALLVPAGTPGDVQPFVDLGLALKARGHSVTLIANETFRRRAVAANLDFAPTSSVAQYDKLLNDRHLWTPAKAHRVFAKRLIGPELRSSFRAIEECSRKGAAVIVQQSMALGARVARDKLGIPTVTVHRQPTFLRSLFDSGRAPFMMLAPGTPRVAKRLQFRIADLLIDRPFLRRVNPFRRELGLPPVSRWSRRWINSPDLVIGFWNEWFAPRQPDWPQRTILAGFIGRESGEAQPSQKLLSILNSGEAPVVFTFGSGMRHGARLYRESVDLCRAVGCRGILATRIGGGVPSDLPSNVTHVEYAPFSWLLPRCAAIVHHGGIGTVGQSLAAGIPQLVVPGLVFDTFDNAQRLARLGVALKVRVQQFTASRATPLVQRLLSDRSLKVQARELSARIAAQDAILVACEAIERLVT